MLRPKFPGQRLLVDSPCDGNRLETHLRRELNAQMTESTQPEDGNKITRPRAAIPKRVKRGQPGAHQRAGFLGGQAIRDQRQGRSGGDHIIGIPSIVCNPGDLSGDLAAKEFTATAMIAVPAVSAIPPHSHPLARHPSGNAWADGVNHSDDLVSWNSRVPDIRKNSLLGN